MAENTYSRKLDSSGRIMIPIRLREQVGLVIGKEYFFSIIEQDGHRFIAIDCGAITDTPSLREAVQIIQSHGLKIVESD